MDGVLIVVGESIAVSMSAEPCPLSGLMIESSGFFLGFLSNDGWSSTTGRFLGLKTFFTSSIETRLKEWFGDM